MFQIDIVTFQGVLLSPHDVDQGALQRVHVEAVKWPGSFLQRGQKWGETPFSFIHFASKPQAVFTVDRPSRSTGETGAIRFIYVFNCNKGTDTHTEEEIESNLIYTWKYTVLQSWLFRTRNIAGIFWTEVSYE